MKHIRTIIAAMAVSFGCRMAFANITEGVHASGNKPFRADAAIGARNLRVKIGSDANHVALAGAEAALGICSDEAEAAEDPVNVALLGATCGTKLGVGSAVIAADAFVVGAAGGKYQALPAAPGTYYVEGKAITACAGDGKEFEMVPCFPHAVTVV
jgi:hypothetical protein